MFLDELFERDINLYQTVLPQENMVFRYRLLSLKEYNIFRRVLNSGVLNKYETCMEVFDRCYIGDSSFISQDIPAGILISIGELILWLSGDCDQHTLIEDLEKHRSVNPSGTVFSYMLATILTVMPIYRIEEIESWDREKLLKIFTIAENTLEKQRDGYQRLTLERVSATKKNKPAHGIDFQKENRALSKHQNPMDIEQTQQRLKEEQLKRLERTRR